MAATSGCVCSQHQVGLAQLVVPETEVVERRVAVAAVGDVFVRRKDCQAHLAVVRVTVHGHSPSIVPMTTCASADGLIWWPPLTQASPPLRSSQAQAIGVPPKYDWPITIGESSARASENFMCRSSGRDG